MEYTVPTYPAIQFFIKWGSGIGALLAVAILAACAYAIASAGLSWLWLIAGVAVAALVWFLFLVLSELLRVVADTLMPR